MSWPGSAGINGDRINGLVISPTYKWLVLGYKFWYPSLGILAHLMSEDEQGVYFITSEKHSIYPLVN